MPVLVDAGALYAFMDRRDSWHSRVVRFLETNREMLVVPAPALPEAAYLVRKRLDTMKELALIRAVALREIGVENLWPDDYERCAELMERYPMLGFVDSAVVALSERLGATRLLTVDRKHFSFVRPRHVERFELLP